MKVLVVDDIGVVRYHLEQILKERGVPVVTAGSGHQAIELLSLDNAIKVVLTDLMMPGMDGLELFKASRKIDRFDDTGPLPPLQFILMTALRPNSTTPRKERNLIQQATDLGFVDVMLKPVDVEHLFRTLRDLEKAESAPRDMKMVDAAIIDELLQKLGGIEAAIQRAVESRDLAGLTGLQTRFARLQQKTAELETGLAAAITELEREPPPAEGDRLLESLQSTLASLQETTGPLRDGGEREAALAACRQLEARAQELRQRYETK